MLEFYEKMDAYELVLEIKSDEHDLGQMAEYYTEDEIEEQFEHIQMLNSLLDEKLKREAN